MSFIPTPLIPSLLVERGRPKVGVGTLTRENDYVVLIKIFPIFAMKKI